MNDEGAPADFEKYNTRDYFFSAMGIDSQQLVADVCWTGNYYISALSVDLGSVCISIPTVYVLYLLIKKNLASILCKKREEERFSNLISFERGDETNQQNTRSLPVRSALHGIEMKRRKGYLIVPSTIFFLFFVELLSFFLNVSAAVVLSSFERKPAGGFMCVSGRVEISTEATHYSLYSLVFRCLVFLVSPRLLYTWTV